MAGKRYHCPKPSCTRAFETGRQLGGHVARGHQSGYIRGSKREKLPAELQASKATAALQASHGVPTAPLPREKSIPARANNVAVPQAPAKASDSQIQQGTVSHQNYEPSEQADHTTEMLEVQNMLNVLSQKGVNKFCKTENIIDYVSKLFRLPKAYRMILIVEIKREFNKSAADLFKEAVAKEFGKAMDIYNSSYLSRSQKSSFRKMARAHGFSYLRVFSVNLID